jgi:hypothetical protein
MPLSKLHMPDTFSHELCRSIGEALHASLVETCGVNPDDNFCLISKYTASEMVIHPTFLGRRDPKATMVVEITLLAGRTDQQKEALYRDFRARLSKTGVEPNNSIVFLVENRAVDWSFSDAGSVKSVLGL